MSLIDFILNLAGLLLWFNWRGAGFDPLTRSKPATLTGTLRRAEPLRLGRWAIPVALLILLFVRGLFYRQLGPAADWSARLDFGAVTLFFRTDRLTLMLIFSALSFAHALVISYFWLLFLSVINAKSGATDPLQKLIRLHLGRVTNWPWYCQLLLPILIAASGWMLLHPLLRPTEVVNAASSVGVLGLQGLVVSGGILFTLKYLIPAFLLVHLVTSYVYLGRSPLWEFVTLTSRNLLAPLNALPLQLGRVDLAPVVGIVVVLLLLHVLPKAIDAQLLKLNLGIWPR